MAKVMVEIEIPDGHEIAIGPVTNYFADNDDKGESKFLGFRVATRPAKPLLICGKPADWPEWLTCDWIARNKNGQIWGYDVEPDRNSDFWFARATGSGDKINCVAVDISGPWEQSLRENPRRKK